jgi:predicted DNA binding protein
MKQIRLTIPTKTLFDAGLLPKRFFAHNRKLEVLRVFAVAEQTAILIAAIERDDALYTQAEVEEMRAALLDRYNLEHFEVVEVDEERKVYTVLLRARIPDELGDAWKTVGAEAFLDGPITVTAKSASVSFVVLGGATTPVDLLDAFNVPYTVEKVRKGPAEPRGAGVTREQRALLRLALDLGYYEVPAKVNLAQLARYTGVSKAAVSKRLRRAERKILFDSVGRGR